MIDGWSGGSTRCAASTKVGAERKTTPLGRLDCCATGLLLPGFPMSFVIAAQRPRLAPADLPITKTRSGSRFHWTAFDRTNWMARRTECAARGYLFLGHFGLGVPSGSRAGAASG